MTDTQLLQLRPSLVIHRFDIQVQVPLCLNDGQTQADVPLQAIVFNQKTTVPLQMLAGHQQMHGRLEIIGIQNEPLLRI